MPLTKGIYETQDGNAAYVSGFPEGYALDLDMAQLIPLEHVTDKRIRDAEANDEYLFDEAIADKLADEREYDQDDEFADE